MLHLHSHKFGPNILEFVINQLQRDKGKFSSWKQKWFPPPDTATSCMPAQHLLVNSCRNSGGPLLPPCHPPAAPEYTLLPPCCSRLPSPASLLLPPTTSFILTQDTQDSGTKFKSNRKSLIWKDIFLVLDGFTFNGTHRRIYVDLSNDLIKLRAVVFSLYLNHLWTNHSRRICSSDQSGRTMQVLQHLAQALNRFRMRLFTSFLWLVSDQI